MIKTIKFVCFSSKLINYLRLFMLQMPLRSSLKIMVKQQQEHQDDEF